MNEGDTEAEVKATRGFNSIDPYLQRQIIAVANSECLTYRQRISKLSSWQDVIPTSTWDQPATWWQADCIGLFLFWKCQCFALIRTNTYSKFSLPFLPTEVQLAPLSGHIWSTSFVQLKKWGSGLSIMGFTGSVPFCTFQKLSVWLSVELTCWRCRSSASLGAKLCKYGVSWWEMLREDSQVDILQWTKLLTFSRGITSLLLLWKVPLWNVIT